MIDWVLEVKQAGRRLSRAPLFTIVSVATVGIGIGAFTSIFALVESVLIEDLPYQAPEELAWVWRDYVEASFPRGWLGGSDIVGMREQPDVFAGVVGFRSDAVNLTDSEGTEPVRVQRHLVTHEFLDVTGVAPLLGRGFEVGEDGADAARVTLLSHGFWIRQFGADPDILGRTIYLDGGATQVIGVLPEAFRFVKHGSLSEPVPADLFSPLPEDLADTDPASGSYAALVRIRQDVAPDRLAAALAAAGRRTNERFAEFGGSPVRLWSVDLEADLVGAVRPALVALGGSAGFLLLILSANLATLFLGRGAVRARELGIRTALGAGTRRMLASVLGEGLMIGVAGGMIGIVLAVFGTEAIIAMAPDTLPRLGAVELDESALLMALGVTVAMAVAAGLPTALHAMRSGSSASTFEDGTRSGGTRSTARTRSALVAVQVALSLMLLIGAGVTAQAFLDLLLQDPGFDQDATLTFQVPLPDDLYPTGPDALAFHRDFVERLSALPGVQAVGGSTALPLSQNTNQRPVSFPNAPGNTGDEQLDEPLIDWYRVTPDYFRAAGHRLLSGRAFTTSDADTATFSVIIDDVLAGRFFPDGLAVGARAVLFEDTATIVGVIDQARLYSVHSDDRGQVYVPYDRFPVNALSYAVRTDLARPALAPAVRELLRATDPALPMSSVRTLDEIVDGSLTQERLSFTLILVFAAASLLLATLGLYGVVSNGVTRRRQEIGVRIALGAEAGEVTRLVIRQALGLAAIGGALGLTGALLASGLAEGIMVGVDARDPVVFAGVALVLLGVAGLASYLPARRATRIDPVAALRGE